MDELDKILSARSEERGQRVVLFAELGVINNSPQERQNLKILVDKLEEREINYRYIENSLYVNAKFVPRYGFELLTSVGWFIGLSDCLSAIKAGYVK